MPPFAGKVGVPCLVLFGRWFAVGFLRRLPLTIASVTARLVIGFTSIREVGSMKVGAKVRVIKSYSFAGLIGVVLRISDDLIEVDLGSTTWLFYAHELKVIK